MTKIFMVCSKSDVRSYFLNISKLFEDVTRNMEAGVKDIFWPPGTLVFKTLRTIKYTNIQELFC